MKLTKFDVGQKVFYLKNGKIVGKEIHSITIEIYAKETLTRYFFKFKSIDYVGDYYFDCKKESELFESEDKLKKHLSN